MPADNPNFNLDRLQSELENSYFFTRFFEFFVGKPEALAPTDCLRGFGGSELEPVCLGF